MTDGPLVIRPPEGIGRLRRHRPRLERTFDCHAAVLATVACSSNGQIEGPVPPEFASDVVYGAHVLVQ